jgi:lipopolysaccharide transport system permease protein
VFSYTGLLLWQYFSSATVRGSTSLLSNASFVTKIYFPRILLPLSTVIDALFDLAVACVVLIPLMIWYGDYPSWRIVFLPVFVLLAGTFALAVSLFVNSLGIQYRDLGLAIPLVVQLGLFATPVVYPITSYPGIWSHVVLIFNPVASAIQGFRWALVGIGPPPGWELVGAWGVAVASLLFGMLLFNRMERTFADEL